MKKLTFLLPILGFSMAVILLAGCKKETSQDPTPEQEMQIARTSGESETESELFFNDAFDNAMGANNEVGTAGTGIFGRVSSGGIVLKEYGLDSVTCYTVTVTRLNPPDVFPVRITINFGNGCQGSDGHVRYGKIINTYTGRLIVPGKSSTTTFENYKIDSIAVTGTMKITNTTPAGTLQKQYTVESNDIKLSKPSGNYIMWTANRIITQTEGNVTDTPLDDIFTITGSAHGKVKRGNDIYVWQSEITEALRKRFICRWISKGIIRIKRETLPLTSPYVALLNFGNGDCDFLATLTINGQTTQIQLPHQ
jgi:hypothetical protein